MNYFSFFDLPLSFYLDEEALRKSFLANSRKYHPDFFTMESEEKQAEVLEMSTLNNEAYKTLKDFHTRIQYILETRGMLTDDVKNDIPQTFLMEMMDVNEAIMDLQFDPDAEKKASIHTEMQVMKDDLLKEVEPRMHSYVEGMEDETEVLEAVRGYYLKLKYLNRIEESLEKI